MHIVVVESVTALQTTYRLCDILKTNLMLFRYFQMHNRIGVMNGG